MVTRPDSVAPALAPAPAMALAIALVALVVWTAHVMGWAVLVVTIGGAALAEGRRGRAALGCRCRAANDRSRQLGGGFTPVSGSGAD